MRHSGPEGDSTSQGDGVKRVLGRVRGARPGPTLICVGGLHGNERAGVEGLRRVLRVLDQAHGALSGDLVALAGNLTALSRGCRFVGRDLNRAWGSDRMRALKENGGLPISCPEDREQIELLAAVDETVAGATGPLFLLDVHTTSGGGGAFTAANDTPRDREFALNFGVPLVLGLEELVDGTMLQYMSRRGFTAALFEGGQHKDPAAVDRVEAAVWIALEGAGLIPESAVPQIKTGRRRLSREVRDKPPVLEMRYGFAIEPGSDFVMRPGYENFKPVVQGEVLGRSGTADVRAPETGRILMPLYQEQGEDGFFIVRSVNPIWLRISAMLRHLGVDRVIHWLPGVERHPTRAESLVADKRVARCFAVEILRLLGYRKKTEGGRRLVVDRRGLSSTH